MPHKKHTFQKLHPVHLRALRDLVADHGARGTERLLGVPSGGLKNAIAGRGVYPGTIAVVAAYFATKPTAPMALPPPARAARQASDLKDLGAAASLVLEALSTVEPANRVRVLDMARAAL